MPKRWIAAAIELTGWLHARGVGRANLDQALLDQWLSEGPITRRQIRRFTSWLRREPPGLRVPGQTSAAALAMAGRERLRALRRLLEGGEIDPRLRVAGCLVLLYAQPVARIVRLTTADAELGPDAPRIRLGGESIPLPAPLWDCLAAMLERRGDGDRSDWLFAGLKAGEPTHPGHLAARLRRLGVPVRAARSSALAALAHRIPAPVLADLLGLSAKTTASASAELKVDYAALHCPSHLRGMTADFDRRGPTRTARGCRAWRSSP